MAKAEEQTEGKEAKPKLDLKKIFKVVFIVINLGGSLAGAALVYMSTLGFHKPSITEDTAREARAKKQGDGETQQIIYTMDPFIVNLDGKPRRTVRAVISLEMLDERGFEEIVGLGASARDSIVRLFNGKTYNDLDTIQGKLFLKDEITTRLNAFLKDGVIKNVYFNELVVQ